MSRSSTFTGSQTSVQSSPPQRPGLLVKCACGLDAARFISQTKKNPDRPFYQCPNANGGNGCKLWQWEDQISGPSVRAGPQTPSSQPPSQPSSQTKTPSIARATSFQTNIHWTSSPAVLPSSLTTRNKRKRSPSPLPATFISPSITRSGNEISPNTRRAAILAALSREAVDGTNTGVAPGNKSDGKPAGKRARIESADMDAFSDDDTLWPPITTQDLLLAGAEEDEHIPSAQVSSRKSVLTFMREETTEDIQEIPVARKLDFTSMRPATQDRPVFEHDPSNPFIVSPSPPINETETVPATPVPIPAETEPLSVISQLESILPQLVSSLPDLKRQVTVLERKKTADAKSVEAKLRRIKALEEEVGQQREEIERLKRENEWLKSRP